MTTASRFFLIAITLGLIAGSLARPSFAMDFGEATKLAPSEREGNDFFGRGVIDGDVAMLASANARSAVAFRFDGTSWVEEQTLPGLSLSAIAL